MKLTKLDIEFATIRKWLPDQYYQHLINRTKDAYRKDRNKAKDEDKAGLVATERYEIAMLRFELDEIKSDRDLNIARKYDLIIPPTYVNNNNLELSEDWIETNYGPIILTSQGRSKIKNEYREEIRWRRERNMSYFSLLFGILGSITALLAIVLK